MFAYFQLFNSIKLYKFKKKAQSFFQMGPRQSSQTRSKQKQFFDNYEIIQELPNDNIRFLQHKQTKKQYLLRELSYTSKQEYLKAIQTIKNKRQQLKNSDHVIPLTEYFEKQEDQYCSTFYKLYVLYEYPQRTLDDEINERNLRKNTFTETELWSILASCILGLSHLQKKGIRHASLRSNMIFLSQEGLIKISDPFTTGYQTNYETLLNKRNTRHIYLSPEQCEALQGELISPANINPYKSDIFTLGMIILECGLLQYQDECYRDEYSRIHMETLEYNKNRFRKAYSQELANMLNYMLGEDANSRPQWIELQNYVITDTSRSFISEGRKSHIFTQSKPVSVNVNHRLTSHENGQNVQSGVHLTGNGISMPSRKPVSQKPITEQKPHFTQNSLTTTKGIAVSSFKPLSVQNFKPPPIHTSTFVPSYPVENNLVISEYRPSIKTLTTEPQISNPPIFNGFTTSSTYQPYQPLPPLSTFSATVTNIPNLGKPSYIVQSPVKNQILSKNLEILPINPSNISATRPFKSVFPNSTYTTKTKVDENLVQVDDDDQTSRSISDLSQYNNQPEHSQKSSNTLTNGQYNFNSANQLLNQSPYQPVNYNNKQSVTNFTVQSANYQSVNQSNQISQQSSPPHNQASSQAEFVIETFKLGSRYEGYKLNGMRHGQGKFFYQDGGMYDGEWVKNKMEGYGKLYYQSGKIAYEGMWVQDQFTGKGVLYNENPDPLNQPFNYENFDNVEQSWTKYEGQFLEDSKNGKGVLYLSNGQYFEGNFLNDTAQGEGVYTTMTGKKIRGVWEMNLLEKAALR